ncbi:MULTISPECIES: alpha/beta hydrolase [Cupriavidus]|uniref:GntR family transcriptional regulator n=1 Tax=Cupriavidus metallidurans TaxID=119219 RepID=A0A482IXZ1_9BURK|nr:MULTISPECIES: alpha/beta fold hydrolase [Cupriavidus]KWR80722.1 GntR family transcriptional regulator [Cupriavidus sp. SHE]QBP13965.1 GntR family transcriptional regulator [Cupriavidus metallidurans]QWC91747.1 alpha/beta hydrolase [Cupriavidus metallidurans]
MSSPLPAPATTRQFIAGPAGQIEVLVDTPAAAPIGVAVVAHPHPSQGGNAEHKIPQLLARILQAHGFLALRPNYRGVGQSEGEYDEGNGETEDVLAVIRYAQSANAGLPLALAGFSFGAFVQTRAAEVLTAAGESIAHLMLTGMPAGALSDTLSYDTPTVPAHALVVHGERDERVPLVNVFDWARPQELPVVVVPGAGHFFTGKLPGLRRVVESYLRRPAE